MSIDPKDLREGDRVRITLDATVSVVGHFASRFTLQRSTIEVRNDELALAEITRLELPIKVGDRVQDNCGDLGTVVHLDGDRAWLRYDDHPDVLIYLAHLTRISENPQ